MADPTSPPQLAPTPDQRRIAAGQFERAEEAIVAHHHDYAIRLLLTCCQLDPANLIYRQSLRRAQKALHRNNLRGSRFAILTTIPARLRLKAARSARDHRKVFESAEHILVRNPWDVGAQLAMAESFQELGLNDQAVWTLEQARGKAPANVAVNRMLARLHEKRGNFKEAIKLWEEVRKADPSDREAYDKAKDLAAKDTIVRGGYVQALVRRSGEGDEGGEEAPAPSKSSAPADKVEREAAPWLQRIKAEPRHVEPYLRAAEVYRRGDRADEARAVLQEGIAKVGDNFELQTALTELEIEPFRHNLALTEEKLRDSPDDEGLRKIRAKLLKEINTRELYLHNQMAERFPLELSHRYELGLRLLRAGQYDEAAGELKMAQSDPRYRAKAPYYLGHCYKARNHWRKAERHFADALEQAGEKDERLRKEVLYQLAQGSADAGDFEKAARYGGELADLDFWYRDIGKLIDEWRGRQGA